MKKRKINLYKYTPRTASSRQITLRLTGVYHDRGNMIATNSHVLCAIKRDYPPNLERKIIDKKGEVIGEKYPRWRSAVPKTTKANLIKLDLENLRKRVEGGLETAKKTKQQVVVKVEAPNYDIYFDGLNFKLFLDFIAHYPDCKVYSIRADYPLKAANKNGDLCLIMPIKEVDVEFYQLAV